MNPEIVHEVTFLCHAVLMGICITFVYDLLSVIRHVVPHNNIWVSVEDLLYWIFCSLFIFLMLYMENNGILRWFAIAGACLGMLFYKKTLGNFFVKIVSHFFLRILHLVEKMLLFLLRPLALAIKGVKRRAKKPAKWLKYGLRRIKKKLTAGKKLIKMILCKQ